MSALPKLLLPFKSAGESAALSLPHDPAGVSPAAVGEPAAGRAALIDAHDRQLAGERLAAIQPLLDFDANPASFELSKSELADRLSAEHRASKRTLFRWQRLYREGGLPALADRQRSDKGQSRWFESNEKAAWVAAYFHFVCRQSYSGVYDALLRYCRDGLQMPDEDLPCRRTVQNFLTSAPPFLRTYALEGRREYQNRMSPYLDRDYYDLAPNEAWVSDHMIHDVEVMNDCFGELEWGAPLRLRATAFEDYRSRYIVGIGWSTQESSRGIATALRRALEKYDAPQLVQFDNGKDYRKVARGAVRAADPSAERAIEQIERTGIIARIGAQVTHCLPHHPQAKPIERMFGTFHQFDRSWHQHYTGGAPHLRPDATSAAMMMHRRLTRHGRVAESTHPPASFFIALALEWIEEYHQRAHSGRGMDGCSPAQIYAERELGTVQTDPAALALLLDEHRRLKVRECAVEWTPVPKGGSRRYTFFDEASRQSLHALNETEVVVAWDPADLDAVAILDDAGHFLTWAKPAGYMRMDPADPETRKKIAQSMSDRRHLEKQTRGVLESIARTARSIGARTPVEALAERTSLAPIIESTLTHRSPKPKPQPDAKAPMTAAEIATAFWRD
jgi:hypothetical protein